MEFTIRTGATSGIANTAPVSYRLSVDLTKPLEHLSQMLGNVVNKALEHAAGGAGSVLIATMADPPAGGAAALKVGLESGGIAAGGSLIAVMREFSDMMTNAHDMPVSAWASYRNYNGGVKFLGVQDDGNSRTPPITRFQLGNSGTTVASDGDGFDFMGNGSNSTIIGTRAANRIWGGNGHNVIKAGDGNDVISAQGGNDTVYGGRGNDTVRGNAGDDYLIGDQGDDIVYSDAGADRMRGGIGKDIFKVVVDGLDDTILDYRFWDGDDIDTTDTTIIGGTQKDGELLSFRTASLTVTLDTSDSEVTSSDGWTVKEMQAFADHYVFI